MFAVRLPRSHLTKARNGPNTVCWPAPYTGFFPDSIDFITFDASLASAIDVTQQRRGARRGRMREHLVPLHLDLAQRSVAVEVATRVWGAQIELTRTVTRRT